MQMLKAEMELIKARYHYNNLDRYTSLKQSELKRDLTLMNDKTRGLMTKLYLDNNGHYQREKEKINWKSIITKTFVYFTFFSLLVFYVYLLLSA